MKIPQFRTLLKPRDKHFLTQCLRGCAMLLRALMCSQNAHYVSRQHQENDVNFGHLDGICQTLPSNHHLTLLFIPPHVDAEKMLKQTIIQVLSTAQNAHVKLKTVSYLEKFLRAETNKLNTSTISVRGERMQSLLKKATDGIGCNFKCTWEFKKQNPLGTSGDTEKAFFLFQRLVELEKSDTPFKDTVFSFIELLQKGIGQLYLSEHSRTLDIDLGVSNAQCTCFECLSQPLHIIGSTTQEANNYSPQFFLLMTRTHLLLHHFFRNFAVKQTLASIQLLGIKMFSSKDICENFAKTTIGFQKKHLNMLFSQSVSTWMKQLTCMKSIQGRHSEVKLEQATVFSINT